MSAVSCATIDQPLRSDLEVASADGQGCAGWFTKLDEIVDGAGVRDAEAYRIPGFPYLRVNRFLASFREQAQMDFDRLCGMGESAERARPTRPQLRAQKSASASADEPWSRRVRRKRRHVPIGVPLL